MADNSIQLGSGGSYLFVGNSFTFGRVDPVMSYNSDNVRDLTAPAPGRHVREHNRLQSVRAASLGWRSRPLRGLRQSGRPRSRCRHLGPQRRDAAGPIPQQQSCRMGFARQRREPGLGRRGAAGQQHPAAAVGFRLHHLRGRFLDGDADHRSDGRHQGGNRRDDRPPDHRPPAPPIARAQELSPEPS